MRLAVIVSEFPKTSETFVLRDLLAFHELGAEVRIYYLAPYRHGETVHDFARPVLEWVHHEAMIRSRTVWAGTSQALRHQGGTLARTVGRMATGFRREPERLAKSLALMPKILALAADAQAWGADHIHATFAAHPATAAWIIGRLTGIPYSVSCHAHDIFTTHALLDAKLGEAAFVRTISDFNKTYLTRHVPGLHPDRIKIIRCGMDLRELQPLPAKPRGAQFEILFVGRLAPQKGIDVLLRALAVAPRHWRLDIMGDGPEGDRLKTLADRLGVGERVRWHGSCRFEDIARAYATADVIAAPSIIGPGGRTEGIPNVLMEALACGRPVVASRVSGVPELVVDGVSGLLVPPGNVEALVAALRRIEDDPAHAAAMAQAGRRMIEQHYDLKVTAASQFNAFLHHRHRAQGAPATTPATAIDPQSSS